MRKPPLASIVAGTALLASAAGLQIWSSQTQADARQGSGLPEFRVGNLVRDQQILERAKNEAESFLNKDQKSPTVVKMINRVRADPRFGLAEVG